MGFGQQIGAERLYRTVIAKAERFRYRIAYVVGLAWGIAACGRIVIQ